MTRLGLAVALALLINLLLFILMSAMVRNSQTRLDNDPAPTLVDFIRPENPEPEPPEHRRPPPQPPKPPAPQPLPRLEAATPPRPSPRPMPIPAVELDLELQMEGGPYLGDMIAPQAPAFIDARELTALLTRPPRYPAAARARRSQGFVEVEFTVTEEGDTEDISVLRAEPTGVFERAAERAVRRWRFEPHVVDGKPSAVRARQRFDFQLEP